ncbi:MAG TPA: nuclear transport factor 2 family protein [Humisphaera sp.]
MPNPTTKAFIQALQSAEASKDVGPLVQLFDAQAELENPARGVSQRGADGAKSFWSDYLSAFDSVHSEFTHVLEADGSATLEWVSEGRLAKGGGPVRYRGTSILEFRGGKVSRFATYYDSAAFVPGGSQHVPSDVPDAAAHPAGGVPS